MRYKKIYLLLSFPFYMGISHLDSTLIEQQHYNEIVQFQEELESKIYNGHKKISAFENPSDVMKKVGDFKNYVLQISDDFFQLKNSTYIGNFYVNAFSILFKGRGHFSNSGDFSIGTRNGWFLSNAHGADGMAELNQLLEENSRIFDQDAIEQIKKIVEEYDFEDPKNKVNHGFPMEFPFYQKDPAKIEALVGKIKNLTPRTSYASYSIRMPTLIELIRGAGDFAQRGSLERFVNSIQRNFYDESVSIFNDNSRDFKKYFGRKEESQKVLQALKRTEKSHVLLNGKTGVRKSTILKILQDAFVKAEISVRPDESSPIFLELSITDVTNNNDPTVITEKIKLAQRLSQIIHRRIILYIDEGSSIARLTRNVLKPFLSEPNSKVHFIISTTSEESRALLDDNAFKRRFVEIHVRELNLEETIALINSSYLEFWKEHHPGLKGISKRAYFFADKYARFEQSQPHVTNPTRMQEFLERAIIYRTAQNPGLRFELSVDDLHDYLRSNLNIKLIPGDAGFNTKLESMLEEFNRRYIGQEGFKFKIQDEIKSFFFNLRPSVMATWVLLGPSGADKTYFSEIFAEVFFNGALLKINADEYQEQGLALNKLIGFPKRTVGLEEQIRSILIKFIKDNPSGGVIVFEKADYLHPDVFWFLSSMITDKGFQDRLGVFYDTSNFVIVITSNAGQDYLIPLKSWGEYSLRRGNIVETEIVNGRRFEVVKSDIKNEAFERVIRKIFEKYTHSRIPNHMDDLVAGETRRQQRSMKLFYVLGPTREELKSVGQDSLERFRLRMKVDYNIDLSFQDGLLEKMLRFEEFEFEKGFSYVEERLEDKLYRIIKGFSDRKNSLIEVSIIEEDLHLSNGRRSKSDTIAITINNEERHEFDLGVIEPASENQWRQNQVIREKIRNFTRLMNEHLYGSDLEISEMKQLLKLKLGNWDTRVVMSLIGTTGNGKIEFAKALAEILFGNVRSLFIMPELKRTYDLNNYFRPPVGVLGSNQETVFEKWFKETKNSGGGIIVLKDLLSFHRLSQQAISEKIDVIHDLYGLLDEGFIKIGGNKHDARGFIIVLTGNSYTELFQHINESPEVEELISDLIKEEASFHDIYRYFERIGIGREMTARFGEIIVKGPLTQEAVEGIVRIKIRKFIQTIRSQSNEDIQINIEENLTLRIARELKTINGGMRFVESGYQKLIFEPLSSILEDISEKEAVYRIDVGFKDSNLIWEVNHKEVVLEGIPLGNGSQKEELNWAFKSELSPDGNNRTPGIESLNHLKERKIPMSQSMKEIVATHEVRGHWTVSTLIEKKNTAQFISIIPGEDALGYVRPYQRKEISLETLESIFQQIVVLQSGHRAPIHLGFYVTGGGHVGANRISKR